MMGVAMVAVLFAVEPAVVAMVVACESFVGVSSSFVVGRACIDLLL